MIYRLKHDDGSIVYPFVKEQLRSTFPNTSFPFPITDELAADFGCLPVATIERPEHDPRTQRLVEGNPEELEDGTLRQVLTVRDATEEEIAAWDASNRPTPDWAAFRTALMASPALNAALADAMTIAPMPALLLPTSLQAAAAGDTSGFRNAWQQLTSAGVVSADIQAELSAAANAAFLPEDVLDAF